jgi:hypothetical protein
VAEVKACVRGLGVEATRGAGGEASRRYREQSRSARVDLLVGWRRPVNPIIRAVGPHLSL